MAFLIILGIAFLMSLSVIKSIEFALIDSLIKLLTHYWHDRLWFKIKWGQGVDERNQGGQIVDERIQSNQNQENEEKGIEAK